MRGAQWPPPPTAQSVTQVKPAVMAKPAATGGSGAGGGGLAALLAKDLEGVPDYPPASSSISAAGAGSRRVNAGVGRSGQDGIGDVDGVEFWKRFPELEMVEAEIGNGERER